MSSLAGLGGRGRCFDQLILELAGRPDQQLKQHGARACALTYFIDVETLPEQYGQSPGPLWLRGANTCSAVLWRVFRNFHSQLAPSVEVTCVRVSGGRADALVGFTTLPASVVKARREGGV